MVLVLATAIALALARRGIIEARTGYRTAVEENAWRAIIVVFHAEVCWSLALAWLRLRLPRPRWRRLMRQPGFEASLAAVISLLGGFLLSLLFVLEITSAGMSFLLFGFYPLIVGPAILTVWLIQMMNGHCRCEPTWIDRVGRVLGACWIATAIAAGWVLIHS
jgi:hypothetical protein